MRRLDRQAVYTFKLTAKFGIAPQYLLESLASGNRSIGILRGMLREALARCCTEGALERWTTSLVRNRDPLRRLVALVALNGAADEY